MSERKTAEIKFRCTPTFKAGVQAAADAAGQSLTEYVEEALWAKQNASLDGTSLVGNAIRVADESIPVGEVVRVCPGYGGCASCPEPEVCQNLRERGLHESGLREFISTNVETSGKPLTREMLAQPTTPCSAGGKASCTFAECNDGTTCSPRSDGAAIPVVTAAELRQAGHPNPELGEGLSKLGFETRPGHTWIHPNLQPADAPAEDAPPPNPDEEWLTESTLTVNGRCSKDCAPWEFCTCKDKA